jgi:membrane-associated PAP2 superfamily phosphatase
MHAPLNFGRRDWLVHAWLPLGIAVVIFTAIAVLDLDVRIAHALYFDELFGRWLGQDSGAWWARDLLHRCGRDLVRFIITASLLALLAAAIGVAPLRPYKSDLLFLSFGMLLVVGLVGALKALTNVDCPWDLSEFAGQRPYVGLFADRPNDLPHAACLHSISFCGDTRRARRSSLWAQRWQSALLSQLRKKRAAHIFCHTT